MRHGNTYTPCNRMNVSKPVPRGTVRGEVAMSSFGSKPVVDDLVQKLNQSLDIPIVPESVEEQGIRWLVEKCTPHIPEWAIAAMATVADGVTMDELKPLSEVLTTEINKALDIPGAPEFVEEKLIGLFVNGLLEYELNGHSLPKE